jgi:glyoxylase-like metal-dependent hydrolase (beta-lactamase superfamily II)
MIHRDVDLPAGIDDLRDGQAVVGDGVTLVPVHTPGHASDHLCYYLPEEKALFTGDVVLGGSTTVIPPEDGDLLDYMASLRRLQGLDVSRIYPAHGPVIDDPQARIAEYIEHRNLRERQILDAISDGPRAIPDIVTRVYVDVAPALHGIAASSVASHLKKLQREGRVKEEMRAQAPSLWALSR